MYGDFGARPAAAEHIFFTTDAGDTWVDLLADSNAMAAVGANPAYTFLRPAGMAFVRRDASTLVLFVATVRGIIATVVPASSSGSGFVAAWRRIGATGSEFPIVKVMSAVWEKHSDVVLVATLGRGVYTLSNASTTLTASLPGVAAAPSTIDLPLVLGLAIGLGGAALLAIAAVAVYVVRRRRRGAQTWRTAGGEIAYQEHDYR
jgi:hypothetical protein